MKIKKKKLSKNLSKLKKVNIQIKKSHRLLSQKVKVLDTASRDALVHSAKACVKIQVKTLFKIATNCKQ